jgi:hypothetical protein
MIPWASAVLAMQMASGPPVEPEIDLARLAPGVVHTIPVVAEQQFTAWFVNRAPGVRYRVVKLFSGGGSAVTYLEPFNPRDDATPRLARGPGCQDLAALLSAVLQSTEESEIAAKLPAAVAMAAMNPCSDAAWVTRSVRNGTRGVASSGPLWRDATEELELERLDASGAVTKKWRFRVAPGPPASTWTVASEAAWIVRETARDIADMAALGRRPPPTSLPKVDVAEAAGAVTSFLVTVSPPAAAAPVTLAFEKSVWAPESYEPLARALVAPRRPISRARVSPATMLAALTDPRPPTVVREDARVSALLTAEPLDGHAHEEAALLLVSLALREAAGAFSDVRLTLARITAHLTMAAVVRGASPASLEGAFAEIGRLTLLGRERDALAALGAIRPASPAERAWVTALQLRNTGDWRALDDRGQTATLLERLEYHRALVTRVGGSRPLVALRRRNVEAIPDWGRILLDEAPSTRAIDASRIRTAEPSFEAFEAFAPSLLGAELKEAAAVLAPTSPAGGTRPQLARLMNEPAGRAVGGGGSQALRIRVVGSGTWAQFYQRHVANAIVQMMDHAKDNLPLAQVGTAWIQLRTDFAALDTLALISAEIVRLRLPSEVMGTRDWCAPAATRFWEQAPEKLTATNWRILRSGCAETSRGGPAHGERRWFGTGPPAGTALDLSARLRLLEAHSDLPWLDRLRVIAPHQKVVLWNYFLLRNRLRGTLAEFDALLGRLAEYDVGVMKRRADLIIGDIEAYRKVMTRASELDPDNWLDFANYLSRQDRGEEAATAFQRAFDEATDRIAVSNDMEWLVLYYIDQHLEPRALRIARDVADTASRTGLLTMARMQERLGNWEAAEPYYVQTAQMYRAFDELQAFYIRYDRKVGGERYRQQVRTAWQALFPAGLLTLDAASLRDPPLKGVEVVQSPASLETQGLVKGVVIVGRDGHRIENLSQYRALQSFSDDVPATLIVWTGEAYKTIVSPTPRPRPVISLQSYTAR